MHDAERMTYKEDIGVQFETSLCGSPRKLEYHISGNLRMVASEPAQSLAGNTVADRV